MAKRQKAAPTLRRSCGAMAAHMALLEQYPQYRANQMRLEAETNQRREQGVDLKKARIVTIKTVVNVVYDTDEHNISQAQIASQFKAMNRDYRATNPDRSGTPAPWTGLVTDARIQFKLVKVTRTKTTRDRLHLRRQGEKARDRRHRAVPAGHAPQLVGLPAHRWTARLRAVPRRAAGDRRGRHQRQRLRDDRHRAGPLRTRGVPRRTRSATTSTCGTSGATPLTAAARTWSPTHRTAPARTPACRSSPW